MLYDREFVNYLPRICLVLLLSFNLVEVAKADAPSTDNRLQVLSGKEWAIFAGVRYWFSAIENNIQLSENYLRGTRRGSFTESWDSAGIGGVTLNYVKRRFWIAASVLGGTFDTSPEVDFVLSPKSGDRWDADIVTGYHWPALPWTLTASVGGGVRYTRFSTGDELDLFEFEDLILETEILGPTVYGFLGINPIRGLGAYVSAGVVCPFLTGNTYQDRSNPDLRKEYESTAQGNPGYVLDAGVQVSRSVFGRPWALSVGYRYQQYTIDVDERWYWSEGNVTYLNHESVMKVAGPVVTIATQY